MFALKVQQGNITKMTLLWLTAAGLTALVIFGFVLPAYYSIDPLGWGNKLGINGLVNQFKNGSLPETKAAASSPPVNVVSAATPPDPFEQRQNTFDLIIPPKQSLDYRVQMVRDGELDYAWKTDGKPLYAELRGEPDVDNPKAVTIFGKPLSGKEGKGFFIAPYKGRFGWHWVNKSDVEVKLKVTAKGMYQLIEQNLTGQR